MDSWNNDKGREIAEEIKKEYGEKNFMNFSIKDQENIIAQKVVEKLKSGVLITSPNDKRRFKGKLEITADWAARKVGEYEKQKKEKLEKSTPTGGAAPVNYVTDPFIQGFDGEPKDTRTPSQKVSDEIDNDKWDNNDISFLEGFHETDKDNHLIKEAKERRKEKAKQKGNKGKGPNGEDGYWCEISDRRSAA